MLCVSFDLSIYLSIHPSIHPSIYLPLYLYILIYIYVFLFALDIANLNTENVLLIVLPHPVQPYTVLMDIFWIISDVPLANAEVCNICIILILIFILIIIIIETVYLFLFSSPRLR